MEVRFIFVTRERKVKYYLICPVCNQSIFAEADTDEEPVKVDVTPTTTTPTPEPVKPMDSRITDVLAKAEGINRYSYNVKMEDPNEPLDFTMTYYQTPAGYRQT